MRKNTSDIRILQAVTVSVVMSVVFYLAGWVAYGNVGLRYLPVNLLLATVSLLVTYPLVQSVRRRSWWHWGSVAWFLLWLGFLPNSFYIVTDVSHLFDHVYPIDPVFGVVLFGLFALSGMLAGLAALYFVHRLWMRGIGRRSHALVAVVLLLSSVAVYWGKSLRWNSWDVALHPVALWQDVAGGLAGPTPHAFGVVALMLVLTAGSYAGVWWAVGGAGRSRK